MVNAKHELILTRSRNDLNAAIQTATQVDNRSIYEDFKIELIRIELLILYVIASNAYKIRLLNFVRKEACLDCENI